MVAIRFGVSPNSLHILKGDPALYGKLLNPGTILQISGPVKSFFPTAKFFPDSAVVYSTSAGEFDTEEFLAGTSGFLKTHVSSDLNDLPLSASRLIERVALDNSIDPRLLIALVEYRCGCVNADLPAHIDEEYLIGINQWEYNGLYRQLMWLVTQLNTGYYGWRAGRLDQVTFPNGDHISLDPELNAGSASLLFLFAQLYDQEEWLSIIQPDGRFIELYTSLFGDPWDGAVEPLYPPHLEQPEMILPFLPGHTWAFTGGPHSSWEKHGPRAALDFAPTLETGGCEKSEEWVVSMTPGLIVRAGQGYLVVDLDGDGNEHSGWVLLYLHIKYPPTLKPGVWIETDDLLGFPSCEGGPSTGTHLHISRRYNGEWILAGGLLPFLLGGWQAVELPEPYKGALINGEQTITSCQCSTANTKISRPRK